MKDFITEKILKKYEGNAEKVVIPENIVAIGSMAFANCEALKTITIPATVTEIESYAFDDCPNLTAIDVDDANPYYSSEDGILFDKHKYDLLKYPEGKADKYYILPNDTMTITETAFENCKLKGIALSADTITIEAGAFENCKNLKNIFIPENVCEIEISFNGCSSLTSIDVADTNEEYSSENGILFNKDKTMLIRYPEGKKDSIYTIPESVTKIGYSAFSGCRHLESLFIPENVQFFEKVALDNLLASKNVIFYDVHHD
ncbi:MAG: leucine-rich repeat domain-containing protein [Firmicutes bacterium]|nr:leucine-rich repeat domain-containing protein [Bacillota bacterium]